MTLPITSRGTMGYVGAALAGGISAYIFVFALMNAQSILVIFAYLAAIPLFVSGLAAGNVASIIAAVTGTAGLYLTQIIPFSIMYFALNALPIVVITMLALRYRIDSTGGVHWFPEGLLVTAIVSYPVIGFLTAAVAAFNQDGGLLLATTHALSQSFEPIREKMNPDQRLVLGSLIDQLSRYIPAVMGFTWIMTTSVCMITAQRVLTRQGWNIRTDFAMRNMYAPSWLVYGVAATGLIATFAPLEYSYIALNLCVMLCVPFFFAGLGIVHAWAEKSRARLFVLIGTYVMFVTVWPALLITLLGVLDQWINFRRRMVAGSPTTH